jgi:hypothetical protein
MSPHIATEIPMDRTAAISLSIAVVAVVIVGLTVWSALRVW